MTMADHPLNYKHWNRDSLMHTEVSDTSDEESVNFLRTYREKYMLRTEGGGESIVVMDYLSKSTQKISHKFRTFLSLLRFWRNIPPEPMESPSILDSAQFERSPDIKFSRSTTLSSSK